MGLADDRKLSEKNKGNNGRRHHYYKPDGAANWNGLDAKRICAACHNIAACGGAVRLGYTRDGGAYAIGVYGDGGQPYTDYLRPSDSVEDYLENLANTLAEQFTTQH